MRKPLLPNNPLTPHQEVDETSTTASSLADNSGGSDDDVDSDERRRGGGDANGGGSRALAMPALEAARGCGVDGDGDGVVVDVLTPRKHQQHQQHQQQGDDSVRGSGNDNDQRLQQLAALSRLRSRRPSSKLQRLNATLPARAPSSSASASNAAASTTGSSFVRHGWRGTRSEAGGVGGVGGVRSGNVSRSGELDKTSTASAPQQSRLNRTAFGAANASVSMRASLRSFMRRGTSTTSTFV